MPSSHRYSPEQQASDAEIRTVLEKAIDALPDDFRAVFDPERASRGVIPRDL